MKEKCLVLGTWITWKQFGNVPQITCLLSLRVSLHPELKLLSSRLPLPEIHRNKYNRFSMSNCQWNPELHFEFLVGMVKMINYI